MSREQVTQRTTARRTGREQLQGANLQLLSVAAAVERMIQGTETPIIFASFAGGYVTSQAPEALQQNASPLLVDFEVSRRDSLVRAPGTSAIPEGALILDPTDLSVKSTAPTDPLNPLPPNTLLHAPTAMLVHSNLDSSTELLLMAAPYIGIKRGVNTLWVYEGLPLEGHWVSTNFAGTLIFTNGRGEVYARDPNADHIYVTTIPVGRTLAAWNNRVWVGNGIINGNFLPMGLLWGAAIGEFEDFISLGTGLEELIYDFSADDGIVALRPMSLDYMAILCKKSIWSATRTSDVSEPGNISPIETGIGCVAEQTARLVYGGVEFLSDVGVHLFDTQRAIPVSEQINHELLPLDYANIDKYWGYYDAEKRRYILGTPTETWVHDIMFNRWYKRSMIAQGAANFPDEAAPILWDDDTPTWDSATDDWSSSDPGGAPDRTIFLVGNKLEAEDYGSVEYFGNGFRPVWRSKSQLVLDIGDMATIKGVRLRYKGAGEIAVRTPDSQGDLVPLVTRRLPDTGNVFRDVLITAVRTGLRGSMEIELLEGNVEIVLAGIVMQADSTVQGRL